MSLTTEDLTAIREVVLEALDIAVNPRIDSLEARMDSLERRMDSLEARMDSLEARLDSVEAEQRRTNQRLMAIEAKLDSVDGELMALKNDTIELYEMHELSRPASLGTEAFSKLSAKDQLLALHEAVLELSRKTHIDLPRP